MNKKALLVSLLFICACDGPDDIVTINKNEKELSGNGNYVGKLSDGRVVKRYDINRGCKHEHCIYVIENTDVLTINQDVKSGKSSYNDVQVIINGKKYLEVKE